MPINEKVLRLLDAAGVTGDALFAIVRALDEMEPVREQLREHGVTAAASRMRKLREKRTLEAANKSEQLREQVQVRDIDSKKEVLEESKKEETLPQSVTPVTPKPVKYPAEFEEVWELFTRKVGKDEAHRAWLKNRKHVPHETLLAALKSQAKLDAGKEKRFIPHPATWLNAGRWQDEELQPQEPCEVSNGHVYVRYGTDAGDAWEQFYRLKKGKPPPRDQKGGWYFPTEFPEGATMQ